MFHFIQASYSTDLFNKLCNKALKDGKTHDFSNEFYSSLTTEFDGVKCGEKLKNETTCGQCYFYSLLLARALPESTLIIGALNALNQNIRNEYLDVFGHGWVEKNGLVYDTTARKVFDKDWYYKNFDASVKESYKSADLADPHLFFRLGINAVKDRFNLVRHLYDIVKDKLDIIYANNENIEQSLKVVYDDLILDEIYECFSLPIKK